MKVVLANPPWYKTGFYGVRAGSRWPHFECADSMYMPYPFFLGYASALLERHGYAVSLFDACATRETTESFLRNVLDCDPDLILLEVSTISIENDLEIAGKLRNILDRRVKIGFAGLHSFMYELDFLKQHPEVDFVLIGEYEFPLLAYVKAIEGKKNLKQVPSLLYRENKRIQLNPRTGNLENLDLLPWPDRENLDMSLYNDTPGGIPKQSVQVWSSRGCPFSCIFCAWPQIIYNDRRYRARNPEDVVNEIAFLIDRYGFESFYFDDDTFNVGRERVQQICRKLLDRGLKIPWAAMCRADLIDQTILEFMADAGLKAVKYGVESATQNILSECGKKLDLELLNSTVAMTKKLGIKCHLTFMFGLPGETYDSAMRTIDLSLALDPYTLQYTIATPFPGSSYYNLLRERGMLVSEDFHRYDGFHSAVVRTENLSENDLLQILKDANRRWKKHIFKRMTSSPAAHYSFDISLIIVNYNGLGVIRRCLDAIFNQTHKNFEVIVVDNGSNDGSDILIKNEFPKVTLLRLPNNRGFSKAVNIGLKKAKGQYIGVINNDAFLDQRWIESILICFEGHHDIGIVASKLMYDHRRDLINSAGDGVLASGYVFQSGNYCLDNDYYRKEREVFGACAAAIAVRASLFNDIGYFDEDFVMYLDDVDFSMRARLWGYRCLFNPEAKVYHIGSYTSGSFYNRLNVYYIAKNNVHLIVKNFPRSILKKQWPSILLHFTRQQGYHAVKTGYGLAYFIGIFKAAIELRTMLKKRKHVLGGRRIEEEELVSQFDRYLKEYRSFKNRRCTLDK